MSTGSSPRKSIYLDHAATTPPSKRVVALLARLASSHFSNPSALHKNGVITKELLTASRKKVAGVLGVKAEEIIFTSGATEGINLALRGVVSRAKKEKIKHPHIVTSLFEHSAVLETLKDLEQDGVSVTYIKPNKEGIITPEDILKAVKKETILVSLMYANNEIGTIQPVRLVGQALKTYRKEKGNIYPLFHSDVAQAVNYLDISVNTLGVDLLTLSGSKIYGPKGSGVLFVKRRTPINSILFGGNQEFGLRPGTEPVYLYAGLAEALAEVVAVRKREAHRLENLRDYFIGGLLSLGKQISLNGHPTKRLPHIVNVSIKGIDNEFFVLQLDRHGIAVSTRSACTTDNEAPSHVILALGKSPKEARESIRFSFGRQTTKKELATTIRIIKKILES